MDCAAPAALLLQSSTRLVLSGTGAAYVESQGRPPPLPTVSRSHSEALPSSKRPKAMVLPASEGAS